MKRTWQTQIGVKDTAKHYHGPTSIAISFGSGASPTSISPGGCRSLSVHTMIATRGGDSAERTVSLEQFEFMRCSAETSSAVTPLDSDDRDQKGSSKDPAAPASKEDLTATGLRVVCIRDACSLNMTRTTTWCSKSGVVALIRMSIGTILSNEALQSRQHKDA